MYTSIGGRQSEHFFVYRLPHMLSMKPDDFDEMLRIQRMMSDRVMQEQRTDHKITVLNALQELGASSKPVQVEALLLEIQNQGVSADQALNLLEELRTDHLVSRVQQGYVQLT